MDISEKKVYNNYMKKILSLFLREIQIKNNIKETYSSKDDYYEKDRNI